MIEALKPKQSLKAAELQDGDIVCFQRGSERKGDKNSFEKRLGFNDKLPAEEPCVQMTLEFWITTDIN